MANKKKAMVEIELDKKRTLRYTLNSLCELEDKLGVALDKLAEVQMGIKAVRTFLWAGLIHEDTELTEAEVGNMVELDNMKYVQEKVTEAFSLAMGKGK